MPEYLAPGVYVEEVSFSAPTIEGVGTTTTGFVGPTLTGPVGGMPYGGLPASGTPVAGSPAGGVPPLLTSFGDFLNTYGGYGNLSFPSGAANPQKNTNYMAMAVKGFFDNGGSMLYVSRVFANKSATDPGVATSGSTLANFVINGRFPGALLNGQTVTVTLVANQTQNIGNLPLGSLLGVPGTPAAAAIPAAPASGTTPATPAVPAVPAVATVLYSNTTGTFMSNASPSAPLPSTLPSNLYVLTMQVTAPGPGGQQLVYSNLGFDPAGSNYLGVALGVNPPRPIDAQQNQIWFNISGPLATPAGLFGALFPGWTAPTSATASPVSVPFTLNGGDDGVEPVAQNYTTAFTYLEPLEDIAIVGAPGASIFNDGSDILNTSVINHVSRQRAYRVAILETAPGLLTAGLQNARAQLDSSYAAMYAPWVWTPNPLAVAGTAIPAQVLVPPTGFMAGIYARNDVENSVAKAPANEVVLGAVDFERHITFAEQAVLNPQGINCLRFFPDRGYRVWGARTVSSDTTLMYINVRRYLIYLEHSIDAGTQWAVFENNGPALWARVTDSIDSFLNNELHEGNLLGTTPSQAYFVRCDRSTMTQYNLDNGQLICVIGVALLKPAEFVIFRIGQMTANATS